MNANLLADPVLGVRYRNGNAGSETLPGVLAGLGTGDIVALTGVRPHQQDSVLMFLCNLAAIVMDADGGDELVRSIDAWESGLRRVSAGHAETAWTLVVDDLTLPAFMQPPLPTRSALSTYKPKADTPDGIDVLQTAKNHDLKDGRATSATADQWAYALICAQTMSGFLGKGNYGVSRMNGGFGSRCTVGVYADLTLDTRWREDLTRLHRHRQVLLTPPWPYRQDGAALMWLLPWDGEEGVGLDSLHPCFIEICRLLRIRVSEVGLVALGKPSKATRIAGSNDTRGNVGDPWIPIREADGAALTVSASGFTPKLLCEFLFSRDVWRPAAMQTPTSSDGALWFHASVLVRGQGTTDGYHEVALRIPQKVRVRLFGAPRERDTLAELSRWGLEIASEVQRRCLRPALFSLLEGGPDGWPNTDKREIGLWADRWLNRYSVAWRERFFPWVWSTVDHAEDEARDQWRTALGAIAQDVLNQALDAAPLRSARSFRGKVRAGDLFRNSWKKNIIEKENAHG